MTKKEQSIKLHDMGYNCAQSVLCSFYKELNISEEIAFKAAEGFGLGMGNKECTCGALTGAIMAAGFYNSTANFTGEKSKAATYALCARMTSAFQDKNGSLICKELRGEDTNIVLRSCPDCIQDGVELIETFLDIDMSDEDVLRD